MRMGNPIQISLIPTDCSLYATRIDFRDSAKKMPGDLKSLGKSIGLPKLESPRGDFSPGWSKTLDYSEDSDDWIYIDRDAQIVAVAMRKLYRLGATKATASGDAWHFVKESLREIPGTDGKKKYIDNLKWPDLFPMLPIDLDRALRVGYFGGLNISYHKGVNEARPGVPLTHEDKHNMYGGIMYDSPLPYGLPIISDNPPANTDMLYIKHCMIKLKLKDGRFPWLQFKNMLDCQLEDIKPGEPIKYCKEWHEMILTSVDLDLLAEWYDIEEAPFFSPKYWIFRSKIGVIKSHLDRWTEVKESSEKGSLEYIHAKLMINSVYGRYALAPETEIVHLAYDEDEDIWRWESEQGINEDNDAYLPFSMFVTAWARKSLLDNCLAVGCDNVIHCDTDSVIHYGPEAEDTPNVIHGDHVGTWGTESRPLKILEGGFKRYIEIFNEPVRSLKDIGMACAGVPQKVNNDGVPVGMWIELLDDPTRIFTTGWALGHEHYTIRSEWLRNLYQEHDMNPDDVNTMKLIPEMVPGGVILRERQHKLNDNLQWRLRR